jgi:hypothetical protein
MSEPWKVVSSHQSGLLRHDQAMAAGLTESALRWRSRPGGPWQLVLPAIYATFTGELSPRQLRRAALLHGGPSAQLTAATAARLHGLRYAPADAGVVDVLVEAHAPARSRGFVMITHTTRLPPPWWVEGLPVSPVDRSVVDASRGLASLRDVRALLCESVQRRRTTVARLEECLSHGHSAGSALARRVLSDLHAGCGSAPESEMRDLFMTSCLLRELEFNQPVVQHGLLLGVPDAQVRRLRLAFECDSREHHEFGDDPELTMRRRARFAAGGWLVVPFSPWRLRHDANGVLADAEGAYLSREQDLAR